MCKTLSNPRRQAILDTIRSDEMTVSELIKNTDGSVDIYMGPDAPKGKEQNWIPTVAGKAWFPYFRFYSPKQAFLDRTWILPDIEKAK